MDQDDSSIKKLSGIFPLIDEYNNEEQKKEIEKASTKGTSRTQQ